MGMGPPERESLRPKTLENMAEGGSSFANLLANAFGGGVFEMWPGVWA